MGTIGLSAKRRPKAASSLPEPKKKTKVGSDSKFPNFHKMNFELVGCFLCFFIVQIYTNNIKYIYIYSHGKSTFFWKSGVMSPFWGEVPQDSSGFEFDVLQMSREKTLLLSKILVG